MKQKKFGRRIQNWHRPLGPSQFRRRFLVHRHDNPELLKLGHSYELPVDDGSCDEYWNYHDPFREPLFGLLPDWDYVDSDDVHGYVLEEFLEKILDPPTPLFRPEWVADSAADSQAEVMVGLAARHQIADSAIEGRLVEYLEKLARFSHHSDLLQHRIVEAIGVRRNLEVVKRVGIQFQSPHLAKRICLFAPFWVHEPQTWDQNGDAKAFLNHLFTFYAVPEFLYSEWFRELDGPRFKWLCWFLVLGQGGSLKRAGELFRWLVPGRFQYYLGYAPAHASPIEACIFSEVRRLGGSELDFARVIRNPAFVIDPTDHSANASYAGFWHETVRWLIEYRDAITDEESNLILSWAMHEYTEAAREHRQPFSWKGRSVPTTLERSIEYQRQVERPWSQYRWDSHGWDWVIDEAPHGTWSFTELTSGEELFHEGQAMHHCVGSYAARCAAGYSAIVSLSLDGIRRITLEINPKTKRVVQARGQFNREAHAEDQRAMEKWMRSVLKPDKLNQED